MSKYIIVYFTDDGEYYYYDGKSPNVENALVIDDLYSASLYLISASEYCGPYYLKCVIKEVFL